VQPGGGAGGAGGSGDAGQVQLDQQQVVQEYRDPLSFIKPVERITVQQDNINDRVNLKE